VSGVILSDARFATYILENKNKATERYQNEAGKKKKMTEQLNVDFSMNKRNIL
jgi:hypothetical protein